MGKREESNKLAIFEGEEIRRTIIEGEWYYSLVDIIRVLTDSNNPRRYWSDLKFKLTKEEGFSQLYENIVQLKLLAKDGKKVVTHKNMKELNSPEVQKEIAQQSMREEKNLKN